MSTNSPNKKVNSQLQKTIETILTDRPIAYHAVLAKAVGSANAGVFLSQFLYWTPRAHDKDGWIYKTQHDIYEETALTRYEQEGARKKLRLAGIASPKIDPNNKQVLDEDKGVLLEKRAGVPSRLYFRVNMAALMRLLDTNSDNDSEEADSPEPVAPLHDAEKPHRTMWKTSKLESGKPTYYICNRDYNRDYNRD